MNTWFGALALVIGVGAGMASTVQAGMLGHEYRRLASEQRENLAEVYGGKVLLIVNTASQCGFTPQYDGLEALHRKYQGRGFAVLGFPSNDFMGQEPGTEQEIQDFCTLNYGVGFPMFQKVVVRGREATPLYRELAAASGEAPKWNFHKYVVDRSGKVVGSFGSRVKPDAPELLAVVEKALAEPRPAARPRGHVEEP